MDTAHHGMDTDHHGTVTRLPLVETTPSVTVRSLGYPRTVVVPVLVMVWPPLPVNLLMIVTGPQLVVLATILKALFCLCFRRRLHRSRHMVYQSIEILMEKVM